MFREWGQEELGRSERTEQNIKKKIKYERTFTGDPHTYRVAQNSTNIATFYLEVYLLHFFILEKGKAKNGEKILTLKKRESAAGFRNGQLFANFIIC